MYLAHVQEGLSTKYKLELKQLEDTKNKQIKKSEQELEQDQKKIQDLQNQLQAKAAQKAAEAAQSAQVAANTIVAAQTAYTAPSDGYKAFIYQHESGNNPGAINASSGACGLGQALPCGKMPCSLSDYACQDSFFTNYAISRYGSWAAAYAFWLAHSWW